LFSNPVRTMVRSPVCCASREYIEVAGNDRMSMHNNFIRKLIQAASLIYSPMRINRVDFLILVIPAITPWFEMSEN